MKFKTNLNSIRYHYLLNIFLIMLFTNHLNAQEYQEHSLISELKSLLQDIEGLTFRQAGSKVVIEGEIYTFVDKQKFDKIMEIYSPEEVVNLVIDRTTK